MSGEPIRNNLAIALAVIFVGGGCLGWVGTKTLDHAFGDVREHTRQIVKLQTKVDHNEEKIESLENVVADFALMKEMLIRVDERTAGWEPNHD